MTSKSRYRRASELGEYLFCHRAWWLHHVEGNAPERRGQFARGHVAHDAHGRLVRNARLVRLAAALVAIVAVALFVRALLGG